MMEEFDFEISPLLPPKKSKQKTEKQNGTETSDRDRKAEENTNTTLSYFFIILPRSLSSSVCVAMFKTLADVAALAKVTRAASGKWHRKAGEWAQKKK